MTREREREREREKERESYGWVAMLIVFLSLSVLCSFICSKICVKRRKIDFQDQLLLNTGQKYYRMLKGKLSEILLTFIKLPFVIKIFVLSNFDWPFYTGLLYTLSWCDMMFYDVWLWLRLINFTCFFKLH